MNKVQNRNRMSRFQSRDGKAFTLVEVLVSLAVLAVLLTIIAQVLGQVQRVWSSANSRVAQFREARRAMDRISYNLSQATLNTYMQFYYTGAQPFVPPSLGVIQPPAGYVRFSELQFVCGPTGAVLGGGGDRRPGHSVFFQAPLGGSSVVPSASGEGFVNLPTALSACGYFIEFDTDRAFRPPFLNARGHPVRERFRLMEFRPPIENNLIYHDINDSAALAGVPNPNWYQQLGAWARPVAENIIYMVISPKLSVNDGTGDPRRIAPTYQYDSSGSGVNLGAGGRQQLQDFQLPPLVEVTLVALDENSAQRLAENGRTLPGGLFTSADEQSFRRDLEQLENFLLELKVNYRVFNATVAIRNSKWGL